LSDAFTTFVRSNAIYSKTTGAIHVAKFEDEVFVFINGMPLRHVNFLHYAIQAIHPTVNRPEHVAETMNAEAGDLLPRIGLVLEDGGYAQYVGRQLRLWLKVDSAGDAYTKAVFETLDEIERKAFAIDPSICSVADLDNHVLAN
jgi:hypothetical protein